MVLEVFQRSSNIAGPVFSHKVFEMTHSFCTAKHDLLPQKYSDLLHA